MCKLNRYYAHLWIELASQSYAFIFVVKEILEMRERSLHSLGLTQRLYSIFKGFVNGKSAKSLMWEGLLFYISNENTICVGCVSVTHLERHK